MNLKKTMDLADGVLFLTGIGKCHPIIASHNILNNLHQVLDTIPVVGKNINIIVL